MQLFIKKCFSLEFLRTGLFQEGDVILLISPRVIPLKY